MKKLCFLLCIIILSNPVYSQSGSITNIFVYQRTDGSGLVDVYFNLDGPGSAYYISLEASFDGGNTYIPIADSYTWADDGPISPGENKHLIWNGLQSCPNIYSSQSIVKLIASAYSPTGIPCPETPTVYYEGQTYNTVLIGSQCWLKENLNIGTRINGNQNQADNGTIEKYCYNNNEAYCNSYGGLYQWDEMMQGSSTPGSQGICPSGWHIPTDGEWCTLTQFIDPTVNCYTYWSGTNAGLKMKSASGWYNNGNGTDASGFAAMPGGYILNGNFFNIEQGTFVWSSSSYSPTIGWSRQLYYNHNDVRRDENGKTSGFSVRCVKN